MQELVNTQPRRNVCCTFPSIRFRTARSLLGGRSSGHNRYGDALGRLAYFYMGHFAPLFHAENENVITISITDACIFSVRREHNPVGPVTCWQSPGDLLRL